METLGNNAYQARVAQEKADLDDKILKLYSFLGSDKSNLISSDERDRLSRQHSSMVEYSKILQERIEAF